MSFIKQNIISDKFELMLKIFLFFLSLMMCLGIQKHLQYDFYVQNKFEDFG